MDVLRYAAFTTDPAGGNPAGIVLDVGDETDAAMQATAAEVGYSETAFLHPIGAGRYRARYFSPDGEVPFCGHATIASAVALADRGASGTLTFETRAGVLPVSVARDGDGVARATLTSVPPRVEALDQIARLLQLLRWSPIDTDPRLSPRLTFAGAWHPVLAASSRERLADLDADFDGIAALLAHRGWTTVNLVWRESPTVFHSRNIFPPAIGHEDPVTGAAAAALGGYLRELRQIETPAQITVHQGADLGRPGVITVDIPAGDGGIAVTGSAVPIA